MRQGKVPRCEPRSGRRDRKAPEGVTTVYEGCRGSYQTLERDRPGLYGKVGGGRGAVVNWVRR